MNYTHKRRKGREKKVKRIILKIVINIDSLSKNQVKIYNSMTVYNITVYNMN